MSFAQFVLFVLENVARVPDGFGVEDESLLTWNGTYHECNRTKFVNYTLTSDMRWPPMKYVILIKANDVSTGLYSRYVRITRSLFGGQRNENPFDQIFGKIFPDSEDYTGNSSTLKVLKTWQLTESDSELLNNSFFLRLIHDIQQIISSSTYFHPSCNDSSFVCPINISNETFSNSCFKPFVLTLGIDIREENMDIGVDKYWNGLDGIGKFVIGAEDFLFGHENGSVILYEFLDKILFESSLIAGITIHVYLKIAYFVAVNGGKLSMMLFKLAWLDVRIRRVSASYSCVREALTFCF